MKYLSDRPPPQKLSSVRIKRQTFWTELPFRQTFRQAGQVLLK